MDAVEEDGSNLRIHSLFQSAPAHTGADSHIANADVGSILLVVYSPLGCIPRKVGIWGPAAVGSRRSSGRSSLWAWSGARITSQSTRLLIWPPFQHILVLGIVIICFTLLNSHAY